MTGEVQEWLNWHAWKACVLQKGTGGSNPPLSANKTVIISNQSLTGVFQDENRDSMVAAGFEPNPEISGGVHESSARWRIINNHPLSEK